MKVQDEGTQKQRNFFLNNCRNVKAKCPLQRIYKRSMDFKPSDLQSDVHCTLLEYGWFVIIRIFEPNVLKPKKALEYVCWIVNFAAISSKDMTLGNFLFLGNYWREKCLNLGKRFWMRVPKKSQNRLRTKVLSKIW